MADWTFVDATFTQWNDGAAIGDITLTVPSGLAVGDLLVANIFRTAGGGASSSTWTLRNSSSHTGQVLTRPIVDAADLAGLPASYVFDWLGTMDAAGTMSAWRPTSGVTMSLIGATASGTSFAGLTLPTTQTVDNTFDMAGTKHLITSASAMAEIGATDVSITKDADATLGEYQQYLTPDSENRISALLVQYIIDDANVGPDISATFDAVGETGTVQCSTQRLAIAYTGTGVVDPTNVSPDAYAAYDRRYARAKALPHMLDTGWLGRQDWTGDLPEEF